MSFRCGGPSPCRQSCWCAAPIHGSKYPPVASWLVCMCRSHVFSQKISQWSRAWVYCLQSNQIREIKLDCVHISININLGNFELFPWQSTRTPQTGASASQCNVCKQKLRNSIQLIIISIDFDYWSSIERFCTETPGMMINWAVQGESVWDNM